MGLNINEWVVTSAGAPGLPEWWIKPTCVRVCLIQALDVRKQCRSRNCRTGNKGEDSLYKRHYAVSRWFVDGDGGVDELMQVSSLLMWSWWIISLQVTRNVRVTSIHLPIIFHLFNAGCRAGMDIIPAVIGQTMGCCLDRSPGLIHCCCFNANSIFLKFPFNLYFEDVDIIHTLNS